MFHHFGWPEKVRKHRHQGFRPKLEILEDRTVLSLGTNAVPLLSYQVTVVSGVTVSVSGTVVDEQPETVSLNFTGIINHTITPDANGAFSFLAEATGVGFINGSATDNQGATGLGPAIYIQDIWDIVDIQVIEGENPGEVTVTGRAVGYFQEGAPVNFFDEDGTPIGSTFLAANLSFSWSTTNITPGRKRIEITDPLGRQIDKTFPIPNRPPIIKRFHVRPTQAPGWYEFHGTVLDEEVQGCTVHFQGIPALNGKSARVDATGKFSIVVRITEQDVGVVQAVAKDRYGAASEPKELFFGGL
ncbi:MAG: hypothetical protein NZM31_09560 [Gemmatales bacterium]|nr:hypothetical protein [Gemmatales bacterium]MDW8387240.1 hypothetical protein [Gemmatales bacterium]